MKIGKKLLSVALAACMVLTMLPTAAFAYTSGPIGNGNTFVLHTTAKLSGNTTVSNYTIGSNSVQWANNDSAQAIFTAWYPTYGNLDSNIGVQSLNVSNSPKPDLMMALPVTGTRTGGVTLQFKHVMHRLVVNLSKDGSVPDDLNDATIALKNMDGGASVDFKHGTVVGSYLGEAYPARANGAAIIIAPQTLQVGSDWIEVTIGTDYSQTFQVPAGSTNFISGEQTILNLQLQSDGIIFLGQSVMPWDANGDGSEDISTVALDIASVPALTAPTNPGWANSTPGIAKWDAVDNASGYTVQLFKNNSLVDTSDAGTALEYNFTSKIAENGNGDYIFNVYARGNGTTLPDSPLSGYSARYVYVKPDQDQAAVDAFKLQLEGITWTTKENTRQTIEDDIDPKLTNLMGPPYYCDMEYRITDVVPATPGQVGSFKVNFTLSKNAAIATTTVNGTIEALPTLPATVDSVTVSPDTATVQKGATQQFTVTVTGTNNPSQEVAWTVDGGTSSGTSISAGGVLTVGADETEPILTVWATSTADQTKSGIAEVTVIPLAAPGNPVWDDETSPHIAEWDAVADAAVYRVVLYNGNKQIGDVIETGTVTQYDFTNAITTAGYGSFAFEVQVKVNSGAFSRWSDRSAVLPLFSPVNSVTVSPTTAIVQKGATRQFTATVNATDGTAQTVIWELVGNTSANTSVSADGLLTVGADEMGTILNVTAVSTVDISKSSTAAVVVPSVETLANTLNNFGLTADVSGSTVTVTGTKAATDALSLIIPTGVKVLWKASLTGAADAPLILLNGDGIFELAGGEIVNTGTGGALSSWDTSLVISGGTASSASKIATVMTYHIGENAPALTMTGGNVISTSDDLSSCAISAGGQTVITGGTVTAGSGYQVVLSNAVVVYQRGLLSKISSGSLSASVAVSPSKTYAVPTETDGLTATGYSVLADHVTAQWNYSNSGWTGVQVDYSGSASGSWKVSYPAVQVVSGKHLLTYHSNGGEGATPFSTVYKGQSYTVSTNIFTRTNYTFTGWNTEANGTGTPYAEGATLTGGPGSEDIVLYAQWSPTGSGSNPGSPTAGSAATTLPTTTVSGSTATTTVMPAVSNGAATGSVTADQMSDALKKAQAAAGTNGTPNVTIQISGASGASSVGTTIPHASMQTLVSGGVGALTVSGPTGSVSFDAAALKTISGASGDVTVTVTKTNSSTLSAAAQALIGNHPVFTLGVTSGGSALSQFGGDVTVSVPYTPVSGEDTNAIVIYYISADGTPTLVPDARYDTATGTVIFTTTHFSAYAVGYNKVSFTDVSAAAWYADAVTFLSARGVTSGTTDTTFSPDATLTRGQFITMLLRAYGVATVTNPTDNFTDAGSTYYTGYLAAAKKLGITSGVGDNKFAPDNSITRQEMFTLLYNALKVLDKLPKGDNGKTLTDFTDSGSMASWAKEAMTVLVKSGTVSGSDGKLTPTSGSTRAQMAQVLYNLLSK
ncbi:exported hypothetical protein [uncultured Eubacteriales bacterium]|uniref:SLH domain-containing protein n=1 Tax=uncultured Eubacteriales bacterium TaxID=172733 RepID=A0A212JM39_9FIRM|nr:exported hypothetical protein [uncultured Eubacteriales bacterium]